MPEILSDFIRTETDRRFQDDWLRQRHTAADILERLHSQEGVVLADQVGMGKTYVALAVAVSKILSTPTRGQVVIFVPAAVADKWVREWKKFEESLLEAGAKIRCVDEPIRSAEEFLKVLDDVPQRRKHIVVVTHTALTATLKDTFVNIRDTNEFVVNICRVFAEFEHQLRFGFNRQVDFGEAAVTFRTHRPRNLEIKNEHIRVAVEGHVDIDIAVFHGRGIKFGKKRPVDMEIILMDPDFQALDGQRKFDQPFHKNRVFRLGGQR